MGRHDQCGMILPAPHIALRQLAVFAQLEGGPTRIHVRDLGTRQPFRTEDGKASAGVSADGPLYLAVGDHAIWLIPSDHLPQTTRGAETAWNALARRTFVERLPPVDAPRHLPRDMSVRASITHMAPPLVLDGGDAPEVAWGVLRLEAGGRKEKRWVSAERLEQGILLGRYSRCTLLVDAHEATTSRVHALLMLLGSDVWLIDLASTNGVRRGGVPISAAVLHDGDQVSLGTQVTVRWTRIQHAQA